MFLNNSILSDKQFANVFSYSVGGLLVLFITCYTKAYKFGYHLFIFAFISIALEDWPKKTLARFVRECSLMISSRSLIRTKEF